VFISVATTHLVLVLAKLGVALLSLVRIVGYVAFSRAVAAFAHVTTHATVSRDLIPMRLLA
jgi:hypothetical protein